LWWFRNGSVDTIKKIIGYINDAKLDPKTGQSFSLTDKVHLAQEEAVWKVESGTPRSSTSFGTRKELLLTVFYY
jgi:hypothetical protein